MPLTKPCRVWVGAKTLAGYGLKTVAGKNVYVHREAWELAHGPIPSGMCVLHECDNPPCYEEEHLFLGTKGDNIRDMFRKGRNNPAPSPRKLSVAQVHAIRERAEENHRSLASDFGVTPQYIGQLISRKWRRAC